MATTIDNQYSILSELWFFHKDDEGLAEFVSFNDIGLPLAYLIQAGIVNRTDEADFYVGQTFKMLVDLAEIEDTGFETLDQMLDTLEEE